MLAIEISAVRTCSMGIWCRHIWHISLFFFRGSFKKGDISISVSENGWVCFLWVGLFFLWVCGECLSSVSVMLHFEVGVPVVLVSLLHFPHTCVFLCPVFVFMVCVVVRVLWWQLSKILFDSFLGNFGRCGYYREWFCAITQIYEKIMWRFKSCFVHSWSRVGILNRFTLRLGFKHI